MLRLRTLFCGFLVFTLFPSAEKLTEAADIGFIETFALAQDRAAALQQLIPGTEDYYYFHCLHYQNNEQFDQVDELLKAWIKRYNYTERVQEIRYRQALLTYHRNPQASLEFVRSELGIQFNHQREIIGRKPNLPAILNQQLISRETLTKAALARFQNTDGFEDRALDWLINENLDPDRRRHFLSRLQRPDYESLPKLVVDDLNHRYSGGFGSLNIHRQLLLDQLDLCLQLKPDLLNQTHFVNTYLTKLQPHADVDWQHDANAHRAYLDRLWNFVNRLAPVHNSLKANVLYHRLVFDREHGIYDKERFNTYIRLPRHASYMNSEYMKVELNRRHACDLNQDFRQVTLLDPVGNDEPLVRSYLHHFFVEETTYKPYEAFLNDLYLKHNFAETKIVNGLGEPEQWYSMLPPAQYQQLRDRIDLDFAFTNKAVFAANEPVHIDLFVKNVPSLIVKVYEINTQNYYRENGDEVNTNISLDGLVANLEETYDYAEPPLRRVARHFDFAQLNKPGVYVIDFIGNGKSSRVVVRKGSLRYLVRTTATGHAFTILDENNNVLKDATLWMSGHEYQPEEDGRILTPYSTHPGRQPIILQHGEFADLRHFQHEAENYQLTAGIYVDREALITRNTAKVVIRPGLYLNGVPVSLKLLEETQLIITSTDHDGVVTTKEISDFQLYEDREATFDFQVPSRLSSIAFHLRAKVHNLSQNKRVDVSSGDSFSLNGIDRTDKVESLHLIKSADGYVIELLGRTGEPLVDRAIRLSLKHRDFKQPVNTTLKSDAHGRVFLGALQDIARVTATGPQDTSQNWQLLGDDTSYLQTVHGLAQRPIEIPFMSLTEKPSRSELSLLELRGNTFVEDRFAALSVENGLLRIEELPPGDYDLLDKTSGRRFQLRVTAGVAEAGYAFGAQRLLELRGEDPLQVQSIEASPEEIAVKLANVSKFARVHVFATRHYPAYSAFARLSRVHDVEPIRMTYPVRESLYAAGRQIGDEYQYIINRRLARRFPGNMLARPELLLNPWAVRGTETSTQVAATGEAFDAQANADGEMANKMRKQYGGNAAQQEFANLDFLADASAVLLNLVPDENGVVSIPRDELAGHQHVHVVAIDPRSTVYRSLALTEHPGDRRDLRLAEGLDPASHYTQQKQITFVSSGKSFEMRDITSSKFEAYDSLKRVYTLYATLSQNAQFIEFGFLLDWPKLKDEEKREKYSKYACHELNFFLFKKDPDFFRAVVLPYLHNKKDATYLDLWLTGVDLQNFARPWNYEQLNIAERILLSTRLQGEQPLTAAHVRDLTDLLPPNTDRFNLLFNTAVKTRELDADNDDLADFKSAQGRLNESAQSMFRNGLALGGVASGKAVAGADELRSLGERRRELAPGEPAAPPAPATTAAKPQAEKESKKLDSLKRDYAAQDKDGAFFFDDGRDRAELLQRQLYRQLDSTKEWAENNYYHLPIEQQNADLVTANAFWSDYASHDHSKPFYSVHLAEATHNFTEMMLALSVLDLPFEAGEHKMTFDKAAMKVEAASPMIVFHEEVKPAVEVADQTPILVSQNFFRHGDRYLHVNNQRLDKYVTDEFLVHAVYGCQVVVTNPTSSPRKLDLLLQVPLGAMPVMNGQYTRTVNMDLQPYNTQSVEYYFYFPAPGEFAHYPVQVASNEEVLAHAEPFVFQVVEELSKVDKESWDYISQNGTEAQVLAYLKTKNLARTNLDRIAWRMQEKQFFQQVIALLSARHAYNQTLWSYGIKHDVVAAVNEFLQHSPAYLDRCGMYLSSPLVTIDPVARRLYQHLEYKPLVNARAHQLGRTRQILNDRFHSQYHQLMTLLSYRRQLSSEDQLAVTYYLLLQDRVAEAMDSYARVAKNEIGESLQYDYLTAYLSFYTDDQQIARDIAERYADYPIDRWRNSFAAIRSQLDELEGLATGVVDEDNREQKQTNLAATEPSFEFKVEGKQVHLEYQNLPAVKVNYYLMDIELLFSRNPFVQQYTGEFSFIRPNHVESVKLPAEQGRLSFDLPEPLLNENVLVEVIGGGQTKTQAYYSNSLALQTIENYGQVRVLDEKTREPLSKVYVKVYARRTDGRVQFYKDGYTDLRGRFDYTSLNTNELDIVDKFSILIMSDAHGAVVREANPPKR